MLCLELLARCLRHPHCSQKVGKVERQEGDAAASPIQCLGNDIVYLSSHPVLASLVMGQSGHLGQPGHFLVHHAFPFGPEVLIVSIALLRQEKFWLCFPQGHLTKLRFQTSRGAGAAALVEL